jgi:uncharacterized sulfatase
MFHPKLSSLLLPVGLFARIFILLVNTPAPSASAESPRTKPNLVLIISDDQAWTDYGFMGHPIIQTPHLDRLASESAVFRHGYVPTALCRPALASLATGLFAHQHKISGNDPSTAGIDPNNPDYAALRARLIAHIDRHPTLPKWLNQAGYLSFQSGKWWEGSYQRGGFTHGMTRGFPERGGRHGDDGLAIGREGLEPVFQFIDHAVAEEKPFFIWYAPFLPHTPHNPPERLLARYRDQGLALPIARYYAMCEWFDETCGELLNRLEAKGLNENTVVAYVGDNGWIQDAEGPGFAPRSKQSPNEGGVRQPILVRWPNVVPPQEWPDRVLSLDLVPTLLQAAGVDVPAQLPGQNLLPLLRDGVPLKRDIIFGEGFAHDIADLDQPEASLLYRWAIRGRWKLLMTYDGQLGRYARHHEDRYRGSQLFDLEADPHEQQNLAEQHPEVVRDLSRRIDAWWPVSRSPLTINGDL